MQISVLLLVKWRSSLHIYMTKLSEELVFILATTKTFNQTIKAQSLAEVGSTGTMKSLSHLHI